MPSGFQAYTTTSYLVPQIRRALGLRDNDVTFSEDYILAFATNTLRAEVWPKLLETRSDYAVLTDDIALVSGTDTYNIPADAVAGTVKDVVLRQVSDSATYPKLARLTTVELEQYKSAFRQYPTGVPRAYAITKEGDLELWPIPDATAQTNYLLRVVYERAAPTLVSELVACYVDPAQLVSGTDTLSVVSPGDGVTGGVTPYDWGQNNGALFNPLEVLVDIISPEAPFRRKYTGLSPTSSSLATSLEVSPVPSPTFLVTPPVGGDWICRTGESVLPMCPLQYMDVLVWGTVAKLAIIKGRPELFQQAAQIAGLQDKLAADTVAPRADEHPMKMRVRQWSNRRGFGRGWR